MRLQMLTFPVLFALALCVAASDMALSPPSSQRVLVAVHREAALPDVAGRIEREGFTVGRIFEDLHALEVSVRDAEAASPDIAAVAGVRYAEPVVRVVSADQPGDPLFTQQRAYLNLVQAPNAWDIEQGKPHVVVAVIDTGVAVQHPDLQANIWRNPAEVANNGFDDDGNGCTDDLNGCSFVSDSSPGCKNITNGFINDDIGHGTFVAGVIAAAANGQGMVGVARGVRIMPVKVLDCYGAGDSVAVARGIVYAAKMGARVINLSLGGFDDLEEVQVVGDAVAQVMRDYNAIVIAAAGNSGTAGVAFPARIPEVIAVGASMADGTRRAPFSSWGPEIDVVAVGDAVIGTVASNRCFFFGGCLPSGPYASSSGTSFSTPQVSGLAALMLSLNYGLTPQKITDLIKASATPLAAGDAPGWAGSGRINMLKTLQAVQNDRPAGDPCVIQQVVDGESFVCVGGRQVRMLQMDAPNPGQCGGDWAKAAAENIFFRQGQTVYLQRDVTAVDEFGRELAAPVWRGGDGADYNLAIVMVYVGLARAADVGANNFMLHDWSFAAEAWAAAAQWNMWAPGKTFNGGC